MIPVILQRRLVPRRRAESEEVRDLPELEHQMNAWPHLLDIRILEDTRAHPQGKLSYQTLTHWVFLYAINAALFSVGPLEIFARVSATERVTGNLCKGNVNGCNNSCRNNNLSQQGNNIVSF